MAGPAIRIPPTSLRLKNIFNLQPQLKNFFVATLEWDSMADRLMAGPAISHQNREWEVSFEDVGIIS